MRDLKIENTALSTAGGLLIALACAALFGLGAGCSAGECDSDADCREGFRCSESGGALFGGNLCVTAPGEVPVNVPDAAPDAAPDAGPDTDADGSSDLCDDLDCTDAERCVPGDEGSEPYCECADGFVHDGRECVADPCDGVDCSGHGSCTVQETAVCECEPGFERDGLECLPTSDDCMTSPNEDCDGWVLRADDNVWEGFSVDIQSSDEIRAAAFFDVGDQSGVIAIGSAAALIVRVDTWEFVESVEHSVLTSSGDVIAAYSMQLDDARTLIAVHSLNDTQGADPEPVVTYSIFDVSDGLRALNAEEETEIGAKPELSQSLSESVRAAWFDPQNNYGWARLHSDVECQADVDCGDGVDGDFCRQRNDGRRFCTVDCSDQPGGLAHVAYVTGQHFHAWAAQDCRQFLPTRQISSLTEFVGQEAPSLDQITAGFWRDGDLYLIRGE